MLAHGSGSAVQEVGLATLLIDLLTTVDKWTRHLRFDIPLLA